MFHQLTTGLMKLRNTNGAMWSPTFNWRSDFVEMIMNRKALLGNVTSLLESVPLIREIANQDALGKYSLYNISSRSFTYNLTRTVRLLTSQGSFIVTHCPQKYVRKKLSGPVFST